MVNISHDSETPADGEQVMSVCAFIYHNFGGVTKVFLPRRAKTKKFLPDVYELPGGHVEFGEDIIDGLKREVKEEFGMDIKVGDPFAAFTYHNAIKGSHSIEVIYFAAFVSPLEQIAINSADHSRYDWFSKDELMEHRSEMIIPAGHALHKEAVNDAEYQVVLKGLDLLAGQSLDFG